MLGTYYPCSRAVFTGKCVTMKDLQAIICGLYGMAPTPMTLHTYIHTNLYSAKIVKRI